MAWYKKLFGVAEQPREVSTGIEIGPGIQLMSGDQLQQEQPTLQLVKSEPIAGLQEVLSLQEQLNALSVELLAIREEKTKEQARIHNEQIRLLRAASYPSIDTVIEALIEAQEGRSERLQEVLSKRAEIRSLYQKI